jgi:tetratricopeptide (TPR) repeat protein
VFASATAGGLLVATLSLAATTIFLEQANQREAGARTKAEENWRIAGGAVDRFFTRVSEDPRLKAVGLEKLRHDLLRDAHGFFERLSRDKGTDPHAQTERARNDLRLARIDEELGESAEAAAASEEARLLFDDLARRYPEDPAYREGLAESFESLGGSHQGKLELAAAESSFRRAISVWEELVRAHGDEHRFRHRMAVALNRLGRLLCMRMDRNAEGIDVLNRSITLCGEVLAARPTHPGARLERSEALLLIGHARDPRELDQVEKLFAEALEIREALAAEHPESPSYRDSLVDACVFVASSYSNARTLDRVRTIYDKARQISGRLAREHPDLPLFAEKHALIEALGSLSMTLGGDHARGTTDVDRAAALAPRSGVVALYAACCYATAAQAARRDDRLAAGDREPQAERYLARAMDYLREAKARGLFRQPHYVDALRTDPDLEPLRPRADFQQFLSELVGSPGKSG